MTSKKKSEQNFYLFILRVFFSLYVPYVVKAMCKVNYKNLYKKSKVN